MSVRRYFLVVSMATVMTAATLWAAEPTTPAAPAAKPEAQAAKPAEAAGATGAVKQSDAAAKADSKVDGKADPKADSKIDPKTAAATAAKPGETDKASPQRFIPSEQVRADFDVSFPIDI